MITDATVRDMAATLAAVDGVEGVVLGGSRARGTHTPESDVDLGLYYDAARLDLQALGALARRWAGSAVDVAGPGSWGPWVDGGAWLTVDGTAVDWILRDVGRVAEQCGRAIRGEYSFHAQAGHPLGFLDVAYAGEVALCRPLADPRGVVARLRTPVMTYPDALRDALVAGLWEADFLLGAATKAVGRRDVTYVALCCSRAALVCAHAWHAAAGVWVVNEKDLVPAVGRLPLGSGSFVADAHGALALLAGSEESLTAGVERMRRAVRTTVDVLGVR